MADENLNFDLGIRATGGGTASYTAYVANSPAGNADSIFELPGADALENFLLKIGQPRRPVRRGDQTRPSFSDLAKSFGGNLFDAVFNADLGACLRSSGDLARSQGRRLRL